MIDAKDLRIGNWISIRLIGLEESGTPHQCNARIILDVSEEDGRFLNKKCYEPIELSPSILERCGFEKIAEYSERSFFHTYKIDDFYISHCRRDTDGLKANSFLHHTGKKDIVVSSLHHLQNIYHSLTGEELTFKPE